MHLITYFILFLYVYHFLFFYACHIFILVYPSIPFKFSLISASFHYVLFIFRSFCLILPSFLTSIHLSSLIHFIPSLVLPTHRSSNSSFQISSFLFFSQSSLFSFVSIHSSAPRHEVFVPFPPPLFYCHISHTIKS